MLSVLNEIMIEDGFLVPDLTLYTIGYYFVMIAFYAAAYIFMSLGLYKMAKSRWIRKPWLAWLPLGNLWILGSISDQYQYVAKGEIKNRRKTLLWLGIAAFVFMMALEGLTFFAALMQIKLSVESLRGIVVSFGMLGLSVLLAIAAVWLTVEIFISLYDLYVSCDPENATMFLVLSIVFSITMPFFVFACRNKERGMPPRKTEQAAEPDVPATESALEMPQEETPAEPQDEAPSEPVVAE